ncbi:MAG: GntR family transcriptional regulator [Lachnospiraceae bacterium]|nr:GntR family transcriptional regulator [Lachnospiraceae bacterium]
MKIIIKSQSELPIYAQIVEQIRTQILSGEIEEGTILPSIRKLAKETGVSVITTTRAYSELEATGYIASMQGKGSIVLPRNNSLLKEQHLKHIEEYLTEAIRTAELLQLSKKEFQEILDTLWKTGE